MHLTKPPPPPDAATTRSTAQRPTAQCTVGAVCQRNNPRLTALDEGRWRLLYLICCRCRQIGTCVGMCRAPVHAVNNARTHVPT